MAGRLKWGALKNLTQNKRKKDKAGGVAGTPEGWLPRRFCSRFLISAMAGVPVSAVRPFG